ncbi:MAG: hypothetical protein WAW36_01445 [Methylovulum miyakonense]|uniref:hypothetical protein n=1 Tax=Methylovulum miyakonense TaxID=645578 RepID=UPI003BB60344
MGADTLLGGTGNDTLKISDFNGDVIDGGAGIDNFQIAANNQTLDLRLATTIKNIEVIRLGDSHSTLKVDTQSVIGLSDDSDTLKVDASGNSNSLKMDTGWTDNGIISGYHIFTKGSAALQVNSAITDIETMPDPTAYTISDVATANSASGIFNNGIQAVTIDFGGKTYNAWGLDTIDLTGFGLEDKLIINHDDGSLMGNARYNLFTRSARNHYISSRSNHYWVSGPPSSTYDAHSAQIDRVSWQKGAKTAKLISSRTYWMDNNRVYAQ